MGLVFGCDWDSSKNETCSNTAPNTDQNTTISTSVKKFGAGSLKKTGSLSRLIWEPFIMSLDNTGMIGVWLKYQYSGFADEFIFTVTDNTSANKNRIQMTFQNTTSGLHKMWLHMYDNTDTEIISGYWSGVAELSGWHYYELNWLWRTGSGITELSHNGVVRITDYLGNTKNRSGTTRYHTEAPYFPGGSFNEAYTDDFVIYDTVLHTGNFTPPTGTQVICGGGPVQFLNLGAPMGGMSRMGR